MKQKILLNRLRHLCLLCLMLVGGAGNVWGATLFHETFGDNNGSARVWNDSYSVKSGVESVYKGISSYEVTNAKQGKNTTGSTQSGLNQSASNTDAVLIIGPLNVASYKTLVLSYKWKAASTKGTYTTDAYYSTSSTGEYVKLSGTGTGATTFVDRTYNLPAAAQVSTLYLKIIWNTSNTQAIIDEVDLAGEGGGASTYKVTYDANGATSGTVPTDATEYNSSDNVTVLGNTGDLAKTNYSFDGWNTTADGAGTNYSAGETFNITTNTTLYANWIYSGTIYKYVEVTDASTLEVGDKVIFVKDNYANGVLTIASETSSYFEPVTVTNFEEVKDEAILPLTLGKSGDYWTFANSSSQLLGMGTAKTSLSFGGSNTTWTISCNGTSATIANAGDDLTGHKIQFNNRFTNYTSSQSAIKLYKLYVAPVTGEVMFNVGDGATFVPNAKFTSNDCYVKIGTYSASELPTATKSKNKFLGWYNSDDSGKTKIESLTVEEDDVIMLEPLWEEINVATVSFSVGDGATFVPNATFAAESNNEIEIKTYTSDQLPTATKKWYVFDGWTCSAPTAFDGTTFIPVADASYTFTAKWSEESAKTLAEVKTLAADTEVKLSLENVIVTKVYTKSEDTYIYCENATTGISFLNPTHATAIVAGKKLSGIVYGTMGVTSGQVYVSGVDFNGISTTDVTVNPTEVTIEELVNNFGTYEQRYLKINKVTFDDGMMTDDSESSIKAYNKFEVAVPTDAQYYNVAGIPVVYSYYSSTTNEFGLLTADAINVPAINPTEPEEYACDATSGSIIYEIQNAPVGSKVSVNVTADWISNVQISETEITFDMTENNTPQTRTATFTLSYTGATSAIVTVSQKGDVKTVDMTNVGLSSGAEFSSTTQNGITVNGAKGGGSYAPKYYTNSSGNATRFYSNNTLTVSAFGYITYVKLYYNAKGAAGVSGNDIGSLSDYSQIWSGKKAGSITFTSSGTNWVESIEVGITEYPDKNVKISSDITTAEGFTTLYLDYATEIPTEAKAYYVSNYTDNVLTLTKCDTYVPANTGVLVYGEKGETYTFIPTAESVSSYSKNYLVGSTIDILMDTQEKTDGYYYLSTEGTFKSYNAVGKTRKANKAYLYISTAEREYSAKGIAIEFDDATGINNANVNAGANNSVYNLSGMRVDNNYKGIVIINGKKYLNK